MKKVTTESSVYLIDEEHRRMQRHPGNDASLLHQDARWIDFLQVTRLRLGEAMEIVWMQGQNPKIRYTTTVTSIEEVEDVK